MKLKQMGIALIAAGMFSANAYASEAAVEQALAPQETLASQVAFTETDLNALFEQEAGKPMQLAALSEQEMRETEGAALWFAPIAFQVGRVVAVRIAHHSAHHTFGSLGRLPHLQMNYWRPGVSGSGGAIRLPLPNLPFFRP